MNGADNKSKKVGEEELRASFEELKEKYRLLEESEARQKLLMECSDDIMWDWDILSNKIVFSDKIKDYFVQGLCNAAYIDFNEYAEKLIKEEDRDRFNKDIKNHLEGENDFFISEYRILLESGDYKWILNRGRAIKDKNDNPIRMLGSICDVTEKKYCEDDIRWMAYHDLLTGLSNKKLFIKELEKNLFDGKTGAVIFIHFDGFKKINVTYGHEFGDKLLIHISDLLETLMGKSSLLSRIGGDEFLILLKNVHDIGEIETMCKNTISIFEDALVLEEKSICITSCIGVSVFPSEGIDANTLLKNADIAMYKSKMLGKNQYSFFNKKMTEKIMREAEIEDCLRNAILDEEFEIYYQPQISVIDNKMIGLEALLRWTNDKLGKVSPAEFIPIAEETGIICAIGEWVIRKSCSQCSTWLKNGYDFGKISINLSVIQLKDPTLFKSVINILDDTGIKADYIKFEFTESAVLENYNRNIGLLDAFIKLGIDIALDDYGTGYSSINYLRKLPIDTLKIDKSFVDNIKDSFIDRAVVKGLIDMADSLGLDVIVEGVELQEQVDILSGIGCKIIQGYFYSKPVSFIEIEGILKKG